MTKRLLLPFAIVTAIAASSGSALGTILIEVSGGYLKEEGSDTPVPYGSGMLMLIASTKDSTFEPITTSSVFEIGRPLSQSGDDYVLFKSAIGGDGNHSGTGEAGEFQQEINLSLSVNVTEGDALQLYWFPSLTSTSNAAGAGVRYGAYRSFAAKSAEAGDLDGSSPWFVPADANTGYSLLFLTSDAGSSMNPALSGVDFGSPEFVVVVPEPSCGGLITTALLGALGSLRRQALRRPTL